MERRGKVIKTLTGGVAGLFKKNGIEVIEGEGRLAGAGEVAVGNQHYAAKTIVLATGSVKKPIPGTQFGGRVIGTEEAWALQRAAQDARRRRRRGLRGRDRLRLRPPGHRGDALRGAGPRAPDRGRRHLQARRAWAQAPGHRRAHQHAGRRCQDRRGRGELHPRRRAGLGAVAGHRRRTGARRRGARARRLRASSSAPPA